MRSYVITRINRVKYNKYGKVKYIKYSQKIWNKVIVRLSGNLGDERNFYLLIFVTYKSEFFQTRAIHWLLHVESQLTWDIVNVLKSGKYTDMRYRQTVGHVAWVESLCKLARGPDTMLPHRTVVFSRFTPDYRYQCMRTLNSFDVRGRF